MKTIHPKNVKVLDYTVEKVTVHQMIITADLVTDQKAVLLDKAEAPVPADSQTLFLEEKVLILFYSIIFIQRSLQPA